jgi:hypothetical protein
MQFMQCKHLLSMQCKHILCRRGCCLAVRRQAWGSASLLQLVVVPLLFYATWAVAYYLKIFVVSAERIRCGR